MKGGWRPLRPSPGGRADMAQIAILGGGAGGLACALHLRSHLAPGDTIRAFAAHGAHRTGRGRTAPPPGRTGVLAGSAAGHDRRLGPSAA